MLNIINFILIAFIIVGILFIVWLIKFMFSNNDKDIEIIEKYAKE